ncbi:MAG: alpha/beta hydrolase [Polyangiaceae bacterium]|nr:alpha/beta hydrolase [Polyangiaceae bacterium]
MSAPVRMGHVLRRAFDRGVHAAAQAMYSLPRNHPGRHGVRVVRDLPYLPTGLTSHLLDVYIPEDDLPQGQLRPAVMYIHGGAFCMLSKDTHRVMALPFAKRGYVVFNVNYRLGPHNLYPSPLEDVTAALHWVLDNARSHGADPNRLIIAGESAGGNLVTALTYLSTHPVEEPFARALFERNPPIKASIPIYGFLDLTHMERFLNRPRVPDWAKREVMTAATSYLGKNVLEAAQKHPLASPLRLLESPAVQGSRPLPPFFIACGTADMLLDDSRRLKVALDKRGTPADLHVFHGEIHGFNAMVWRPAAKAKWRALFQFLRSVHMGPPAHQHHGHG